MNIDIDLQEWDSSATNRSHTAPVGAEVQVRFRVLDSLAPDRAALFDLLSPDERERVARFRIETARHEFILARGTLRVLLAARCNLHPAEIRFKYSAHGKPMLDLGAEPCALRFNVSHTDGLAVFAFACAREVVERIQPKEDVIHIAERFFSSRELDQLRGLAASELPDAFFRCWTRKEAYIKARGGGLSIPLDQFDVTLLNHEPVSLLATRPDAAEAARWSLHELAIRPGYSAALAVAAEAETHPGDDTLRLGALKSVTARPGL